MNDLLAKRMELRDFNLLVSFELVSNVLKYLKNRRPLGLSTWNSEVGRVHAPSNLANGFVVAFLSSAQSCATRRKSGRPQLYIDMWDEAIQHSQSLHDSRSQVSL